MGEKVSVFKTLNKVNLTKKTKTKNNLTYLPWSDAWAEIKKIYPDATYTIHEQTIDDRGNTRFWFDDGKTGWTKVSVTINGLTHTEQLPIMDFRNQALTVDKITSVDANKSLKRCFTKACALHGLGLYIFRAEDIPEEEAEMLDLQEEVTRVAKKKSALSEKAKEQCIEYCKEAERKDNPDMDEEFITGKIANITNMETLDLLHQKLLTVRK